MKHKRLFTLTLSILLLWAFTADAQFTVKIIYFQPTDTNDKTAVIRDLMAEVHDYYGREMQRLIHVRKTFRIETDANDQIVVHTIKGNHPTARYIAADTYNAIAPEIPNRFKVKNNSHVIFVGGLQKIDNSIAGIATSFFGNVSGGWALIPANNMPIRVVVHELAHTFGVKHNLNGPDDFVMGLHAGHSGFHHYEARWMDKSHYFNDDHPNINFVPKITKAHPIRVTEPRILQFKMDIESVNGIHQAEIARFPDSGVLDWESFNGEPRATATFEFNVRRLGNDPILLMRVMDTHGNMWMEHTEINIPPAALDDPVADTTPIKPSDESVKPVKPEPLKPEPEKDDNPEPVETEPEKERNVSVKHKLVTLWAKLKRK